MIGDLRPKVVCVKLPCVCTRGIVTGIDLGYDLG